MQTTPTSEAATRILEAAGINAAKIDAEGNVVAAGYLLTPDGRRAKSSPPRDVPSRAAVPAKSCTCCDRCNDCGRRTAGAPRPYGMCQECVGAERRAYEVEEHLGYGELWAGDAAGTHQRDFAAQNPGGPTAPNASTIDWA